jgi:hypothetical protein
MSKVGAIYGLIQFSSFPERFEFINIGVLLVDQSRNFFGVKFVHSSKRVDKMFGRQSRVFFEAIKRGLENRLRVELGTDFNVARLRVFASSRANAVRISRLLPIVVDNPKNDLEELFKLLVSDDESASRLPKVNAELKKKFEKAGIENLVEKPEPIDLPQGVTIDALYGYKNGSYNLIDPVRLHGPVPDALAQASKRAIEGKWLYDFSLRTERPKQLIVVGEVSAQEQSFVRAIIEMMGEHHVRFYNLDNIEPLVEEIKKSCYHKVSFNGLL